MKLIFQVFGGRDRQRFYSLHYFGRHRRLYGLNQIAQGIAKLRDDSKVNCQSQQTLPVDGGGFKNTKSIGYPSQGWNLIPHQSVNATVQQLVGGTERTRGMA